ncbi:MAG: hypothetical protein J3R72DRAFT_423219 [Linnemannia gamsii]|nr:MAG: hypothetical protein J3R72DRAFT_423219 [Linnemannia gamsii]
MTNNLPNVQAFRPIPKSSVDTPVSSSSGQKVGTRAGIGRPLSQAPVVYCEIRFNPLTHKEFVLSGKDFCSPKIVLDVVIGDLAHRAEALPGQATPPVAQQTTT